MNTSRSADRRLRIRSYQEVAGEHYGTPKELWGFSKRTGKRNSVRAALAVLQANADLLGLPADLAGIEPRKLIASRGGWHVIFNQTHLRTRIHRAYVTAHMNRDREVYLIKNRAVPADFLPRSKSKKLDVVAASRIAHKFLSREKGALRLMGQEQVWYPYRNKLRLAYKFRIHRTLPREEWLMYIDAENGKILSSYDNISAATGTARVFSPNPVVTLRDWKLLLNGNVPVRRVPVAAYQMVKLRDIAASGVLNGPHVTTRATKNRLKRSNLDFEMHSHEAGFEEVMVYYHLDQAIRYIRSLGYTGERAIFHAPLEVNARATRDDNSWYSPGERMLSFGTGDVDDAEDAETIIHEFGHALQDAICPDFGQSAEAAAMGEGFSDYFAASFFAKYKIDNRAKRFLPAVMTWDGILFGPPNNRKKHPPCVRRVDGPLTYRNFNHRSNADEHKNGEIWGATLWSIWRTLGREVADSIIVESHFQLDGFTTFARGARAIMDADRNLYGGRHVATLRNIFQRRAIGPL